MNDENRFLANDKDVEVALDSVLTTGSAYFKELWSGPDSDEKQRAIMIEVANKKGKPVFEDILRNIGNSSALRTLLHHDILEKNNGGYCFKLELVRRWIEQQI